MTTTAIILLAFLQLPSPAIERAPKLADSYQPSAPTVRYTYSERCVTTLDARGNIESRRCGL
jgi:hypothetical protein